MTDFPYVLVPGKIQKLFAEIRSRGRPGKVNVKWLEAAGFKSKNDRPLKGLLEGLGYVGHDGTPTPGYGELKGSESQRAASIAAALRRAYGDLLNDMPDAPSRSNKDLSDYFSAKTGAGDRAVGAMVGTFKALCQLADFGAEVEPEEEQPTDRKKEAPRKVIREPAGAIRLSVNISLALPATDNADIYDKIFAAVAKHLRDLISESGE